MKPMQSMQPFRQRRDRLPSPPWRWLGRLLLAAAMAAVLVPGARAAGALSFDLPSPAISTSRAPDVAQANGDSSVVAEASDRLPSLGHSLDLSMAAPRIPSSSAASAPPQRLALKSQTSQADDLGRLFAGGANSWVARTVGSAEGTRSPNGDRTAAYYGHVDPGNGVWNLGSFSYQHGARSPEAADRKQLARLAHQAVLLRQQAQAKGLTLSLLEELNGIDLANQAPLAALDRGYIDWLHEARQRQLSGDQAIVWARAWSYWDPDLNQWNAPGLGNQWDSIYADQLRRHRAIMDAAIALRLPL